MNSDSEKNSSKRSDPHSHASILVSWRLIFFVMVTWHMGNASAADNAVPRKSAFTQQELQKLIARNTPLKKRRLLWTRFRHFSPKTPKDVDLLYSCFDTSDAGLQSLALQKLRAMRKKELVVHSRKFLAATNLQKAKTAMHVVRAAKDRDSLAAIRKLVADPKFGRLKLFGKKTLALLGDPELLNELTDPKRQPRDSTLRGINRELLKEYGRTGFDRVLAAFGGNRKPTKSYLEYISYVRDPATVPKLIELYEATPHDSLKEAILGALSSINTRECQPTLRTALEDDVLLRKLPSEMGMRVMWAVWRYDDAEVKRFRQQLLTVLTNDGEKGKWMAAILAGRFPMDRGSEAKLALALAKLLPTRVVGREAASSLRRLTKQRFRYAKPLNDSAERAERAMKGRLTAQDLGLTEESVKRSELRYRAMLETIRKKLDNDKTLSRADRKRTYEISEKMILGSIEAQKKLLKAKHVSPWNIGIPISDADKWLRQYYKIGEDKKEE